MRGQCSRRVQIRIAVYRSVAQKLRLLEAWNHSQHSLLLGNTQASLKSNEIPHPSPAIFLTELHDGVSVSSGTRIAKANWLQRSEPQSVPSALRHHFDRHAALEVRHLIELVSVELIGRNQRVEKRLVLLT